MEHLPTIFIVTAFISWTLAALSAPSWKIGDPWPVVNWGWLGWLAVLGWVYFGGGAR
jgi:hypothetical protein